MEDNATFYSPSEEWIEAAASTIRPEEREFVVDSGASMHVVSRKDLDKAELETVRISKNPTTVVTPNGEVLTKEEATIYVKEMDLFVTVTFLEETSQFFRSESSAKNLGVVTIGPVARNHISSKMAGKSFATQRTMYHSLSLVYRRVLQLHPHLLLL